MQQLVIGDKNIDTISGPVSMHILYPKPKYLKLFPKAPILILFGDHHFDDRGYCTIQNEDKNIIHFNVFDREFLQLFSNAVGVDGVDLYLEGGAKTHDFSKENTLKTELASGRMGAMKELWKLFRECYRNTRMKREPVKDSGCDVIKNIRWQSSDIRGYGQYKAYEDIQFIFDNLVITRYRYNDEDLMLEFRKMICFEVDFKGYLEHVLLIQDEFIKKYLYDDKSLIVKQLKKINDQEKKKYLIDIFKKYIKTEYEKTDPELLKEFMLFNNSIIIISNDDNSGDYKTAYDYVLRFIRGKIFEKYTAFILGLFTLLPDLYILARSHKYMLKTNDDESKEELKYPLLNIVYYGDYHVKNLVTCLGEIYDILSSVSTDTENWDGKRCIFVNKHINLNKYIADLKLFRLTQPS